jgi:VanZ family protein
MIPVLPRRLAFWAAAVFAFVMAVIPHPPELPGQPNDKIQHIVAFAALGLLSGWAYARTSIWGLFAGLSLYGALIEIVQAIPALNRDSDIKDWVADTVACGIVLLTIGWFRSRQARPADVSKP